MLHTESKTFSKEALAKSWAKKREVELEQPGALSTVIGRKAGIEPTKTVGELIADYIRVVRPMRPWADTKQNVLQALQRYPIAAKPAGDLIAKDIVDHCVARAHESSPTTANGDYMYLRQVLSDAEDLLGCPVNFGEVDKAQRTLKKIGAISKSAQRDRRPGVQELSDIVELAWRRRHSNYHRKGNIELYKIIVFAMFSSRRLSEICRITRSDTDFERQEVLIRDMKHPGQKKGNDVWCYVPDEAWKIMLSMEQQGDDDRWFPFVARSVSDSFQRTRKDAGHYHFFDGSDDDPDNPNLRFHDLRHECASWLFEKNGLPNENWDVPRVALVTGHQDWNSLKCYVNMRHVKPIDKWSEWEWKGRAMR